MPLSQNINSRYAVSIIVPNYNHERYLEKRLNSIYEQSVIKSNKIDYEVILLDDCSTDNSRQILSDYAINNPTTTTFYPNSNNSGSPFKQWSKGCHLAKHDIVWIAESDDYCKPNFLEELLPHIAKKECTLTFCSSEFLYTYSNENSNNGINESENTADSLLYYNILSNTNQFAKNFTISSKEFVEKYLSIYNTIPNVSAVVMKRSKILEYIDTVTDFKVDGDYLLFIKMLLSNPNKEEENTISYIAKPLNYYRKHAGNTTNSKKNQVTSIKEHSNVYDYLSSQIELPYNVKMYQLFFQYINTASWLELDAVSVNDLFAKYNSTSNLGNLSSIGSLNKTFSVSSILDQLNHHNRFFSNFLIDILGINLSEFSSKELESLLKIEFTIDNHINYNLTKALLDTIDKNSHTAIDNTAKQRNIFTNTIYCTCCESIVTTKVAIETTNGKQNQLCPECGSTPAQRLITFIPYLININWRFSKLQSNYDNEYTNFVKLNCLRFSLTQ